MLLLLLLRIQWQLTRVTEEESIIKEDNKRASDRLRSDA